MQRVWLITVILLSLFAGTIAAPRPVAAQGAGCTKYEDPDGGNWGAFANLGYDRVYVQGGPVTVAFDGPGGYGNFQIANNYFTPLLDTFYEIPSSVVVYGCVSLTPTPSSTPTNTATTAATPTNTATTAATHTPTPTVTPTLAPLSTLVLSSTAAYIPLLDRLFVPESGDFTQLSLLQAVLWLVFLYVAAHGILSVVIRIITEARHD